MKHMFLSKREKQTFARAVSKRAPFVWENESHGSGELVTFSEQQLDKDFLLTLWINLAKRNYQ